MLESMNSIDLNASTFEAEYNNYQAKKLVCAGSLSLSHWEMDLNPGDIEPNVFNDFYKWLLTTSAKELDRYNFLYLLNTLFSLSYPFVS